MLKSSVFIVCKYVVAHVTKFHSAVEVVNYVIVYSMNSFDRVDNLRTYFGVSCIMSSTICTHHYRQLTNV